VGFDCTGPHKKKVDSKVPLARNEIRNKPGETAHPRRYEICWDSRARQKKGNGYRRTKKNEQFATRADGPRASLPEEEGGDPTPDGSLRCTPARAGSRRRKVEERLGKGIACDIVEGRPREIGPGRTRSYGRTGGAVITLLPPLVSWIYNESRAGLWRGPGLADKRGEGGLVI
jgi:hypothetical protein